MAGALSVLFVVNRSRGHGVIGLSYGDSGPEGDSSLASNVAVGVDEIASTWSATVAQRSDIIYTPRLMAQIKEVAVEVE